MQSIRASKRRKLDQDNTSKSSPASRQPVESAKKVKPTQPSPVANAAIARDDNSEIEDSEDDADNALSAHDQWLLAKAKSAQRMGKRPSIYNDIVGGKGGREPYSRMPKPPKTSKPKLEPIKQSKPSAAPLDFFKQFAKGKVNTAANAGVGQEAGSENEVESSDDSSDGSEIAVKHIPRIGKYWAAAAPGKTKKTFEDEFSELEEATRDRADASNYGSEDELAENGELRCSPARKNSMCKPIGQHKGQNGGLGPVPKAFRPQPLDRRKNVRSNTVTLHEEDSEDEMEIGDSEDERVKARTAFVQSKELSTPKKAKPPLSKSTTSTISLPPFQTDHLQRFRKILLEKCTGKRPIPLTNLDEEYAKVYSLIDQTITAGESNSMLLIGARGSGKTALIDRILHEQNIKHPGDYHIVRLSGFIHTDDKIALREIWRQLGREMEIEDGETSKNYADTLTTLLALLSHPAETGRDEAGHITKSVIFILDEFELFATHPRQTLLYNLFDIAQSRKAPIAVMGCTTRIDVAETLEKRVKSRFSHRYVHLSMSKSLQAFEQVCRSAVSIRSEELRDDERSELEAAINGVVAKLQKAALSATDRQGENGEEKAKSSPLENWNILVDALIKSKTCASFLTRLFHTNKSIPEFLSSLMLAMATLPISNTCSSAELLENLATAISSHALHPPDSKLSILESLSSLQLALLICAARLTNIYNSEIVSFALAYEEYKNLASKAKIQASASGAMAQGAGSRVWGKSMAKGAWEGLVECGLILEDGRGGRVDVGMEEIGVCGVDLGSWARWCREI